MFQSLVWVKNDCFLSVKLRQQENSVTSKGPYHTVAIDLTNRIDFKEPRVCSVIDSKPEIDHRWRIHVSRTKKVTQKVQLM